MEYSSFIQPKSCEIGGREFTISQIPAFTAKKVYQSVVEAVQKYGDIGKTLLPEDVEKVIFAHTAVVNDNGDHEVLGLPSVIEKYLSNYADHIALVVKMLDHNFGFLTDGTLRVLLGIPAEVVEAE